MSHLMPTPVWSTAKFWTQNQPIHAEHDVRQSEVDPAMIAYYQNADKKSRDIRTRTKPGRYLNQYFGSILTPAEIKFYATWQATQVKPDDSGMASLDELLLAMTPDDIEHVYTHGPSSCMSGDASDYRSDMHPTRVYGAGDLAIAYLQDEDRVIARAICWPEKKVYGRIYPAYGYCEKQSGAHSRLKELLLSSGYQSLEVNRTGFDGARLIKSACSGGFVMPYLDNNYGWRDEGSYLRMYKNGESATSTDGLVACEDEAAGWCERCEESIQDEDDMCSVYTSANHRGGTVSETWCSYCAERYAFYCHGFSEYMSNDVGCVEVESKDYSQAYAYDNFTYSDYSDEYFDGESVELDNGETWSLDEFEDNGFTCAATGCNHDASERHKEYPDIHRDCSDEEIADYLAIQEAKRIDDERQLTFDSSLLIAA